MRAYDSFVWLRLEYSPFSQKTPKVPGAQEHVNSLTPSVQVPAFWQGLLAHSSVSDIPNDMGLLEFF